jgi:hypothetical protein
MEEFFNQIRERYIALSDEEKDTIRAMAGTEQGRVLSKVLGPELMSQIRLRRPTTQVQQRRGLATR